MWLMGEERRKNKVSNNTINVAHNISLKWNLVEVWGNIMYLKTEIPHMPQTAAHMFKPAYRPIASVCLPSSTFTPVSAQLFWVKMPFSCSCNQQRQRERERERERGRERLCRLDVSLWKKSSSCFSRASGPHVRYSDDPVGDAFGQADFPLLLVQHLSALSCWDAAC